MYNNVSEVVCIVLLETERKALYETVVVWQCVLALWLRQCLTVCVRQCITVCM